MKTKRIMANIFALVFFGGLGAITVNFFYRFGATVGFWAGFFLGIVLLILICAFMVSMNADGVQRSSSKFFLDLRQRQRHAKIIKQNSAI